MPAKFVYLEDIKEFRTSHSSLMVRCMKLKGIHQFAKGSSECACGKYKERPKVQLTKQDLISE